ncbi:FKBP12-interacting protein of 37 kDa [Babesia sp. Xinjiang]|uniref:FKBP12-interacting protein of 37 kDa n=1 Tax=Babesia sp. Xinjiang TaxID=462227 RepID=UPI000A215C8F|nr:FKBP12-interacting protein of 37 kDa [Babesia sp. Xinjiang]ORM39652.1 FKBP12-interacting protein of 37 kDa [Babesia sp. Xinjiang]
MTKGKTIEDIVNGAEKLTDANAIKAYFMTIVSAQQKEIQKTKYMVTDFRTIHNFDDLYEKKTSINALIDPVINCEILHLKRLLNDKNEEIRAANQAMQAQNYNPQSAIGTTLLERCKLLIAENEQLGKIVIEGRVQPLTLDLYKERQAKDILKQQVKALYQYNEELETETELLTKKVKEMKQEIATLKKNNEEMNQLIKKKRTPSPNYKSRHNSPSEKQREDKRRYDEKLKRDEKDKRDERTRKIDKHEDEWRDSKHSSSKKDEKYDSEKKTSKYDNNKDNETNKKYDNKRESRHSLTRKEDKTRRNDSRSRTSAKRYRDDSRGRMSPYRSRSPKSVRSSRKY